MGQWFLQWGWALAMLVVAVSFVMMWYRSSVDAWARSGGDWKKAIALEVGPFVTFAVKVSVGAMVMTWAVMYVYGVGRGSPISQSFYQLGTAGVSALSGTFGSVAVSIPEAPSLTDALVSNIPSEADLRNVLTGSASTSGSSGSESVPAADGASSTWTADPASAATTANETVWTKPAAVINTNQGWGNAPVFGPVEKPVYGPKPQPTVAPQPTQGPAEKPAGWNVTFGGGGPLAVDADAAVASATATTYTVKRGDYLSKIATAVGVPASVLCRTNRLADCNNLRVGMVLTIPAK